MNSVPSSLVLLNSSTDDGATWYGQAAGDHDLRRRLLRRWVETQNDPAGRAQLQRDARREADRIWRAHTCPSSSSARVPQSRSAPRLRERRERRHVARKTSSTDGPDGEPGSPPRRISFDPPRDAPARWRWVSEATA